MKKQLVFFCDQLSCFHMVPVQTHHICFDLLLQSEKYCTDELCSKILLRVSMSGGGEAHVW